MSNVIVTLNNEIIDSDELPFDVSEPRIWQCDTVAIESAPVLKFRLEQQGSFTSLHWITNSRSVEIYAGEDLSAPNLIETVACEEVSDGLFAGSLELKRILGAVSMKMFGRRNKNVVAIAKLVVSCTAEPSAGSASEAKSCQNPNPSTSTDSAEMLVAKYLPMIMQVAQHSERRVMDKLDAVVERLSRLESRVAVLEADKADVVE